MRPDVVISIERKIDEKWGLTYGGKPIQR